MADPPDQRNPASPISILLHTLGMTREDLARHSTQMRNFLEAESSTSRPSLPKPDFLNTSLPGTRYSRSRTHSFSNGTLAGPSTYTASPPATPVKKEPIEHRISTRPKDTMELVMERKSRERKRARKESQSRSHEQRDISYKFTSTPSKPSTSQNLETPHHYKYYSERVIGEVTPKGHADASESPTKGRPHYRGLKTPSKRLLDSSWPSSPMSSPQVVNQVSSPGPMRTEAEAKAEEPPFTLPPGPYSDQKPDACYAAIIGQAILSSPQHQLTLQDIYEWITIVYPHYKRGEQTWMNSVRHALSTMAVFRKIPRQRQEGKSLWAIWDGDVPCFANGDFKKSLCADMVKPKSESSKTGPKKRSATEQAGGSRNSKRRRKDYDLTGDPNTQPLPPMIPAPMLPPFYSSNIVPGTHHQPYYQQHPIYVPQPVPAEVIFPPLPPTSSYHHARAASSQSGTTSAGSIADIETKPSSSEWAVAPATLPSSDLSLPELTHDVSSSEDPPLSHETFAAQLSQESPKGLSAIMNESQKLSPHSVPAVADPEDDFERWLAADPPSEILDSGFGLFNTPLSQKKYSSRSASLSTEKAHSVLDFFQIPDSPTPQRKSAKKTQSPKQFTTSATSRPRSPSISPIIRRLTATPTTPPPRPHTPPRKASSSTFLQLSPERTPISHRGLHMSPSASLAHYKTHLDPPPPASIHAQAPLLFGTDGDISNLPLPSPDLLRTPRRRDKYSSGMNLGTPTSNSYKFGGSGSAFGPVTPKRLNFNTFGDGSPLRTPTRNILDPHDPSALLDEELSRLGNQAGSSYTPTGLFGNMREMLYESPTMTSPSRWGRHW